MGMGFDYDSIPFCSFKAGGRFFWSPSWPFHGHRVFLFFLECQLAGLFFHSKPWLKGRLNSKPKTHATRVFFVFVFSLRKDAHKPDAKLPKWPSQSFAVVGMVSLVFFFFQVLPESSELLASS